MLQFNADDPDSAYVNCAVCENAILNGRWFARIKQADTMAALCCPLCTETFQQNPTPYVRRIQTYEQMRQRTTV